MVVVPPCVSAEVLDEHEEAALPAPRHKQWRQSLRIRNGRRASFQQAARRLVKQPVVDARVFCTDQLSRSSVVPCRIQGSSCLAHLRLNSQTRAHAHTFALDDLDIAALQPADLAQVARE
jgi:hypothetical protein